jgi:hypothetical protein
MINTIGPDVDADMVTERATFFNVMVIRDMGGNLQKVKHLHPGRRFIAWGRREVQTRDKQNFVVSACGSQELTQCIAWQCFCRSEMIQVWAARIDLFNSAGKKLVATIRVRNRRALLKRQEGSCRKTDMTVSHNEVLSQVNVLSASGSGVFAGIYAV